MVNAALAEPSTSTTTGTCASPNDLIEDELNLAGRYLSDRHRQTRNRHLHTARVRKHSGIEITHLYSDRIAGIEECHGAVHQAAAERGSVGNVLNHHRRIADRHSTGRYCWRRCSG